MRVFRLAKEKYAKELSGKGASKSGNRWNSKGTEIVYTSESRVLAMAEVAVHLTLATLPRDYVMLEIEIPDSLIVEEIQSGDLPKHWNIHPPGPSTQKIGDAFIDSMQQGILKVPSAMVQGDYNYLLNPYHKDFKKIKIVEVRKFPFDKRIFQ